MNDEEFCDRLLMEEKVGVVPGTCFGLQGKIIFVFPMRQVEKI